MKIDQKWLKVTGIAVGLPGLIFTSAFVLFKLSEKNLLAKLHAIVIFLLIIFYSLFLLVKNAIHKKNKPD